MKKEQKVFLMVWIPVVILVSLALTGNIGKYASGTKKDIFFEKIISFEDMLPGYIVLYAFSILLYFIVGLDEIKPNDHSNIRKT